ncbi:TPA: phosphoribosyltransferase [Candidatus Micrarchaeota archaeon]|nr:MAG: hypothetical protein AUJ65_00365 [Candidatus Micrarchaeota archaeon CG1_02_51_15]HII39301.1 phosphoribosyltransferase [Candidatus Micrarchaeota archaeon]
MEAHERLGTPYGRRRTVESRFKEFASEISKKNQATGDLLGKFLSKSLRAHDSLNPLVYGTTDLRASILNRLENIASQYPNNILDLFPPALAALHQMITVSKPLPADWEHTLAIKRYASKAAQIAEKREIKNKHLPHDTLAAFHAAAKAVKSGGFDYALIVGPEGVAYEARFNELGLPTVAVNVPEARPGKPRQLKKLDDLSLLKGKKVLVVEDDVRTGATLQRVLKAIKPHAPASLELFLGLPEHLQLLKNVPADFKRMHITPACHAPEMAKEFRRHLKSRGVRVFKHERV